MIKSISFKLFIILVFTLSMIQLFVWLILYQYTQPYYEKQKLKQMKIVSNQIIDIIENDSYSDTVIKSEIQNLAYELKGIALWQDKDGDILYSTFIPKQVPLRDKYIDKFKNRDELDDARNMRIWRDIIKEHTSGELPAIDKEANTNEDSLFIRSIKGLFLERTQVGVYNKDFDLLVDTQEFEQGKIMVCVPIYSIKSEILAIKNLYIYISLGVIVFAVIISFALSKNITRPILHLKTIANEMKGMNFDLKYTEKRNDEIGELGQALNCMNEELKLTFTKLQEELEKEKSLDKLRKQFVAQVSHELQTPISVVKGYIEALQDGILDSEDEERYYYDVIEDECKKMSKLIINLLDLSQLEAGTFKLELKEIDLNQLVKGLYLKYHEITKAKNIQFELIQEMGADIAIPILGDYIRLEQVISNFIQNALKNVEENGRITLGINRFSDIYRVYVFNTGDTIPDEDIPYIWESFYKAKNKREKKGTGLGLAISKYILSIHNARHFVQNVDNGVVFGFEIAPNKPLDCI